MNAFCVASGTLLGQVKTAEKSSELTAIPGLLALGAPGRLWIAGEPVPALTKKLYQSANAPDAVTAIASADRAAAAAWLLE